MKPLKDCEWLPGRGWRELTPQELLDREIADIKKMLKEHDDEVFGPVMSNTSISPLSEEAAPYKLRVW